MSVFKFGGEKPEPMIHGVRLRVRPGTQKLPEPLIGAYVTAFSIAADPREAVVNGVRALRAMGLEFEAVDPEGMALPLSGWGAYVDEAWPDFPGEFPSQSEIADRLADGGVVFTPFAGFERE